MPAGDSGLARYADEIEAISDELVLWDERVGSGLLDFIRKGMQLGSRYPVPVISDYDENGARAVRNVLGDHPDVIVFDFPHSAVLAPKCINIPSVLFTHNVEAEIFERHWKLARSPLMKLIWGSQYRKMRRYEKRVLSDFDTVVAVSERDCNFFGSQWQIDHCRTIPTGVDTRFFGYRLPDNSRQVVFCGSMDWMANIDGIEYFYEKVWPLIRTQVPDARMKIVGRKPPRTLVDRICNKSSEWEFTGFVDDVRDHIRGAAVFIIPLRVGGGTRIKAFEAMAMGSPVVSTSIGIEGLPVIDGVHYLCADDPASMADKVTALLRDDLLRTSISKAARQLVEEHYDFRRAARVFENICLDTIDQHCNR